MFIFDVQQLITVNRATLSYSLILAILLVFAMVRRNPTRKRILMLTSLGLHICATVARLISWFIVREAGYGVWLALMLSTTLADVFSILTCWSIMVYVYTDVSGRQVERWRDDPLILSLWVLNCINLLFAVTNPWTHAWFSFTSTNIYVIGPLFWVRNLLFLIQGVALLPVVVRQREQNGAPATLRFFGCGVMVVASLALEWAVPGLSLLFPSVSLFLALLSIGVQSRLEEDLAQARAESAESRVRLLSGQIRPHFVFNSLTAIKELVSEDPERAEVALQDFSDYLRSHLDVMADTRLIPFELELSHVRHYVSLELADAMQPLQVNYDLGAVDFMVPPLTVQPLVENAIRHGLLTREGGGTVTVKTRRREGFVEVTVTDDGHGFSSATGRQTQHWQVGIDNVRERLERQCHGTLDVHSSSTGTQALIRIPEGGQS